MSLKSLSRIGWSVTAVSILFGLAILYVLEQQGSELSVIPGIFLLREPFLSGALNVCGVAAALGTAYITIYLTAGPYYESYKRFKDLGIKDALPSRSGRLTERTAQFITEIMQAKRSICLTGVTLGGWFDTAWADLQPQWPAILKDINTFEIYILDPNSAGSKIREQDETSGGETLPVSERVSRVLRNLASSMEDAVTREYWKSGKIQLFLYQGTPLSAVQIDDTTYLVVYLPYVADRECPQLELVSGGRFSGQLLQSLKRIQNSADTKRITEVAQLQQYIGAK